MRADAAIVTEPTELELVVAHKGFVWLEVEVTGRAAHGSRPHLGVDAIVKAGPVLTALGELDVALGARDAPAARPRLGARVADRRRRRAVELPGALRDRARAAHAAGRDGGGRRGASSTALLDRLPRARTRELDAERRTLLVREPFEVAPDAEIVARGARRGRRRARRAAGDRRRELLGRRGVHRRGRHPDGHVRAGGRGRPRGRGVGRASTSTEHVARALVGVGERICA